MRFVIAPDAALRLMRDRGRVPSHHGLLAPTLLRSQVLSDLYRSARRGEIDRAEAQARLEHMRALRIRLLGDRVLQREAWSIAADLGWEDTLQAEYLALTRLQAEAFVTLDAGLARSAGGVVPLAPFGAMFV